MARTRGVGPGRGHGVGRGNPPGRGGVMTAGPSTSCVAMRGGGVGVHKTPSHPVVRGRKRGRPPLRANFLATKYPHQVFWTVEEKHRLLEGLKQFGSSKPEPIKHMLPNKTLDDVKAYIYKTSNRAKTSGPVSLDKNVRSSAPIEVWLDLAEALTEADETLDYSWALSKVMSMVKTLEYHDPSLTPNMPNYNRLYAYLEALLEHKPMAELPRLSLIDAGVLLDLLQDLALTLKNMQTTDQMGLMKWKRSLLELAKHHTDEVGKFDGWRALLERFPEGDALRSAIDHAKRSKMLGHPVPTPSTSATQPTDDDNAANEELTKDGFGGLPRPSQKIIIEGVEIDVDQANAKRSSLFTINPFCIPVHYLKPLQRPVAPIARMDDAVLNSILHKQTTPSAVAPSPRFSAGIAPGPIIKVKMRPPSPVLGAKE